MVVAGLGNPGKEYAHSRHNAGADTVALLAERHGCPLRLDRRVRALLGDARIGMDRVVLAFPQTYMNDSGDALRRLVRRVHLIEDLWPERLVVVHDELDLPPGRIRVKCGGGLAGHKGLASIRAHLHSADFVRVRIGVGKPPNAGHGVDFVLSAPGKAESELVRTAVVDAADAVELILSDGIDAAMNRYNAADRR